MENPMKIRQIKCNIAVGYAKIDTHCKSAIQLHKM